MGFGLLFLGYLFMYSFPYKGFDVLPDIIGFIICYIGIRKLAEYGCGFDNLKKYMYMLLPGGLVTVIFQILGLCGYSLSFKQIWDYCYIALVLFFNLLILVAIYKIAEDTGLKSITAKVQRNLIIGIIYYILMLFFELPFAFVQNLGQSIEYLGVILLILGYIWQTLNLTLIFSCYMWICAPGDEDMPERKKKPKNKEKT